MKGPPVPTRRAFLLRLTRAELAGH